MSERYDAVVIGAGPAGEVAVTRLHERGMRIALVERELVGGECAYWACIPSKTLLRPAEVRSQAARTAGTAPPKQRWADIAAYRDFMVRHLDDAKQVEDYERSGVRVYRGAAKLAGAGRVEVGAETLETERIVIATGSEPRIPSIPGLAAAGYWTNREATTLSEPPASIAVLGGGPVGIELGQLMRRFGAEVDIIDNSERLLAREEPRVSELIADALREEGIGLHLGREVSEITTARGRHQLRLDSGETLSAEQLLVATGRTPRVAAIGLASVGIEPDRHGIKIDERCRAGENIWAVGDVTGVMPFTHVGMYQARIACADILGEPAHADYGSIPRVVFCDPEIAAVGLSASQAAEHGLETAGACLELADSISRPWTYETSPRGEIAVLADRATSTLVGAWAVSPLASEWIHYAALAIKTKTPLAVLRDTVAQFPTYSEAYLKAIEALEL